MTDLQQRLSALPSVDALLRDLDEYLASLGRDTLLEAARREVDQERHAILAGAEYCGDQTLRERVLVTAQALLAPSLVPVINATGVVLHTNLGRAPLSGAVLQAMQQAGQGYSNLEFDLESGKRGSRYSHAENLLCRLTGAEAALLVNNNAGAVLLTLSCLARGQEVVISRGQLVEIGGGFRIPDVMTQSGAQLVEVGTTNRTYIRDYEAALGEGTAALMRVHTSNFRVRGFTHEASLTELVELAHQRDIPVFDDLGSGTLLDTQAYGLVHEPTVQESVQAGADIITFSGDKLLGGPQAGIIVGKAELIAQLKGFPLTRALRVDKTTIAGIQANLLHYLRGEAERAVPVWRMISTTLDELAERTEALLEKVGPVGSSWEIVEGRSAVGGGSLPDETLPAFLLSISVTVEQAAALRTGSPAVVARIQQDRLLIDLRTVLPEQEDQLARRLVEVFKV